MTKRELLEYLKDVPDNCVIMSNSGWEAGETNIGGIWYNKDLNECHMTQGGTFEKERGYHNNYGKQKPFEMIYCVETY